MEKIDILVKGVPVPIYNMFNGLCSMSGKSISDGVIEAMTTFVENASRSPNGNLKDTMAGSRQSARRR